MDLKQFERYLQKKELGLMASSRERYLEHIDEHIPSLSKQKIPEQIEYMNKIIPSGSGVLRASFLHFLKAQGAGEQETRNLLHSKHEHKSRELKEFLQTKVLSRVELQRLFTETHDLKLRTIFSTLYDTACRRAELLSIKVGDILFLNEKDPENKRDLENGIYAKVGIIGKGGKARTLRLRKFTVVLIKELVKREKLTKEDKLFTLYKEESTEPYKRQENALYTYLIEECAKVLPERVYMTKEDRRSLDLRRARYLKHVHPHCFRHTKATHLADEGADILSIASYLGHEKTATSEIYVQISSHRADIAHQFSRDIAIGINPLDGLN